MVDSIAFLADFVCLGGVEQFCNMDFFGPNLNLIQGQHWLPIPLPSLNSAVSSQSKWIFITSISGFCLWKGYLYPWSLETFVWWIWRSTSTSNNLDGEVEGAIRNWMLKFPLMGVLQPSFVLDIWTPKTKLCMDVNAYTWTFELWHPWVTNVTCLMPMLWRKSNCLAILLLLAYSHVQLVNGEIPGPLCWVCCHKGHAWQFTQHNRQGLDSSALYKALGNVYVIWRGKHLMPIYYMLL